MTPGFTAQAALLPKIILYLRPGETEAQFVARARAEYWAARGREECNDKAD